MLVLLTSQIIFASVSITLTQPLNGNSSVFYLFIYLMIEYSDYIILPLGGQPEKVVREYLRILHGIFEVEYLKYRAFYGESFYRTLIAH